MTMARATGIATAREGRVAEAGVDQGVRAPAHHVATAWRAVTTTVQRMPQRYALHAVILGIVVAASTAGVWR